jgi:hypothetical protein
MGRRGSRGRDDAMRYQRADDVVPDAKNNWFHTPPFRRAEPRNNKGMLNKNGLIHGEL